MNWGGAEGKGERERIPSRLHTLSKEPNVRLNPQNCERTEPKSRVGHLTD